MEGGDESDRENSYSSRRPEVIHTNIPIRESQTPSEDVVMKISAMECKLLCSVANGTTHLFVRLHQDNIILDIELGNESKTDGGVINHR